MTQIISKFRSNAKTKPHIVFDMRSQEFVYYFDLDYGDIKSPALNAQAVEYCYNLDKKRRAKKFYII